MTCAFEVSRVISVVGGIRECESEVRAVLEAEAEAVGFPLPP